MIADGFLGLITALINGLFGALPSWTINLNTLGGNVGGDIPDSQYVVTNTGNGWTMAIVFMRRYNSFVPFDQMILMVTFLFTLVTVFLAYKSAKLVIGWVRGAGTN